MWHATSSSVSSPTVGTYIKTHGLSLHRTLCRYRLQQFQLEKSSNAVRYITDPYLALLTQARATHAQSTVPATMVSNGSAGGKYHVLLLRMPWNRTASGLRNPSIICRRASYATQLKEACWRRHNRKAISGVTHPRERLHLFHAVRACEPCHLMHVQPTAAGSSNTLCTRTKTPIQERFTADPTPEPLKLHRPRPSGQWRGRPLTNYRAHRHSKSTFPGRYPRCTAAALK